MFHNTLECRTSLCVMQEESGVSLIQGTIYPMLRDFHTVLADGRATVKQ